MGRKGDKLEVNIVNKLIPAVSDFLPRGFFFLSFPAVLGGHSNGNV